MRQRRPARHGDVQRLLRRVRHGDVQGVSVISGNFQRICRIFPPNPSNSPAPGLLLRLTTVPGPRVSAGQPYPLVFRLGLPYSIRPERLPFLQRDGHGTTYASRHVAPLLLCVPSHAGQSRQQTRRRFDLGYCRAGWITAIATAGLLIGATVTAVYAAKAFGKQAQEVGILLEQNKREAAERRRVQAARVFIGAPRDLVRLVHPYAQDASDHFPGSTMLSSGIPAWAACPSPMTSVRSCLANVSRVLIPSGPTTPSRAPSSRSAMLTASAGYGCQTAPSMSSRPPQRAKASSPSSDCHCPGRRITHDNTAACDAGLVAEPLEDVQGALVLAGGLLVVPAGPGEVAEPAYPDVACREGARSCSRASVSWISEVSWSHASQVCSSPEGLLGDLILRPRCPRPAAGGGGPPAGRVQSAARILRPHLGPATASRRPPLLHPPVLIWQA